MNEFVVGIMDLPTVYDYEVFREDIISQVCLFVCLRYCVLLRVAAFLRVVDFLRSGRVEARHRRH